MERHQITGHTELIGLLAYPIRHSQSPATHNAAYEKLGVDIVNLAFEVDAPELEDAIKGLRALKMRGANVSMPNKTIVHQYLDEISPAAKLCGAVNTIVNKDGYLVGHITDGIGYVQSLKDNDIDPTGKKVTIVGSGGAATAVEIQAALDGVAEMSIFARDDKFTSTPSTAGCSTGSVSSTRYPSVRSGFSMAAPFSSMIFMVQNLLSQATRRQMCT